VTEGHPDKVCDQISDAVLDAIMAQDPNGRVACETVTNTGLVLVTGEISTTSYVDIPKIARDTIREIGYTEAKYGFDCDNAAILTAIEEQSADIALGVNKAYEAKEGKMSDAQLDSIGAGDQGMMFGYACNETKELMPLPISLAHKLAYRLAQVRKTGLLPYLRPDGKTQVTVEYHDGVSARVDTIVISAQHDPEATIPQIKEPISSRDVVKPHSAAEELLDKRYEVFHQSRPAGSCSAARPSIPDSPDAR
jgi:S-adenosylmethionine synthetase